MAIKKMLIDHRCCASKESACNFYLSIARTVGVQAPLAESTGACVYYPLFEIVILFPTPMQAERVNKSKDRSRANGRYFSYAYLQSLLARGIFGILRSCNSCPLMPAPCMLGCRATCTRALNAILMRG